MAAYDTSKIAHTFAKKLSPDLWEYVITRELQRQFGQEASEIISALKSKGLKGEDFNFIFLKVMEIESSKNKNPENYIGRSVTWQYVIKDYDSWKEELIIFRSLLTDNKLRKN